MVDSVLVEEKSLHIPSGVSNLPPGWSWRRLDDVCEGVFDCPHSTPRLVDTGPFVARSQDILTGVFRVDQAACVSEETYKERTSRAIPVHGDLLYSREGTYFGIAAEVPRGARVCLGQRMVLLRPNAAVVDFRFLRYWLNSPTMAAHIHGYRDGSVAERLNLPTIRSLPVLIPPLHEQHVMARALGALEQKVELNRRMNETLGAMAQALFKSWFVDFEPVRAKAEGRDPGLPQRLADLFPDSFEDSELGEVPKGWEVRLLGELVEVVKGRSYKSEELVDSETALVTLKSFARGGGYRQEGLKSFAGAYKPEQIVKPGEVVIACTDVTQAAEVIGRAAIVRGMGGYRTLVASLDTLIVRPRHSSVTPAFLYFLGRTDAFVSHTYAHSTGTTVLHLSKDAVPSFRFANPPKRLVEQFDSFAGSMLSRIQVSEEESSALVSLRDSLLPKLISGELRAENAEGLFRAVS